jgi:hypothetical protein
VSIELLRWGEDRTVVIIDEHPLTGVGARWHSVPLDAALRLRNRRMMRSLARVVREWHQGRRRGVARSPAQAAQGG